MVVLHTCKNEEDPIKNDKARVLARLYIVFSDAQGQLRSQRWNSAEIQTYPSFYICPRNLQDPIKNEGARVLTSLLFDFSDAQG